jgi:glycosyltransferase involved in cell wall biosynthesis
MTPVPPVPAAGPGGRLRILGFGTYDRCRHPRVGVLLDGFGEAGDWVAEANVPLGLTTAERVAMLRRPWTAYRLAGRLAGRWVAMLRAARRSPVAVCPDAVVVGYMGHFDVLAARAMFRRRRVVLDFLVFAADTAADRGFAGVLLRLALTGLDRAALAAASMVLVDTPEHRELLPPRARRKAVIVAVGAERVWFSARPSPHGNGPPGPLRVVFYGLFTPLQGAVTIGRALAVLAARSDIEVTMIGTGQDRPEAEACGRANGHAQWIDWVPAAELPLVVAAHHVCLGIFGTTAKAQRVVPNKAYQGAAAGCAIVTSSTAPQRRALGGAAAYVAPGDPRELAGTLVSLAGDRSTLQRLRTEAARRSDAEFTPSAVAGPLRRHLLADPGQDGR